MEEFMCKSKIHAFQCDACGYLGGKAKEVNEIKMKHKKLCICDECLKSLKLLLS